MRCDTCKWFSLSCVAGEDGKPRCEPCRLWGITSDVHVLLYPGEQDLREFAEDMEQGEVE